MKPVRVTVLVSSLTIGGAEQLLLEFLRNVDADRFRMHMCFLRSLGLMGKEMLSLGFPCTTDVLKHRFDFPGVLKLARVLKREKTEVLFLVNHRNTLFYGVPAAKLAGVPAIINWENETFKRYSHHAITMLGRRFLHLGIDRVVAAAGGHRDYIAAAERIPHDKIAVIYNGVNPKRFDSNLSRGEARVRLGVPAESPVVSIVAVLRPDKAHENFLKTAQIVLQSRPEAHFLIVGDGPERNRLEELSGAFGIDKSVHFLGFQRELGDILAAVDVNTLSSRPEQETLSVAAIEAMSAGVPIVCTDVGFMKEIVIPGETGFLTGVDDPQAMADRLVELIGDPARCRSMGETARERVLAGLSAAKMTRAFENLFVEVLEGKA